MNMPKAQQGFINVFLKVSVVPNRWPAFLIYSLIKLQSLKVLFGLPSQPTLTSFNRVVPEFGGMALEHLDKTMAEWAALEASGFKM